MDSFRRDRRRDRRGTAASACRAANGSRWSSPSGWVWTAEALNTAVEFLADEVSLEDRELIGHAKDTGAAAVLLASITSAIVGLIVFVPHLLALMGRGA